MYKLYVKESALFNRILVKMSYSFHSKYETL